MQCQLLTASNGDWLYIIRPDSSGDLTHYFLKNFWHHTEQLYNCGSVQSMETQLKVTLSLNPPFF